MGKRQTVLHVGTAVGNASSRRRKHSPYLIVRPAAVCDLAAGGASITTLRVGSFSIEFGGRFQEEVFSKYCPS